jgi:hypothetical protein
MPTSMHRHTRTRMSTHVPWGPDAGRVAREEDARMDLPLSRSWTFAAADFGLDGSAETGEPIRRE